MTIQAAEKLYEAQHVYKYEGVPTAVYNPSGKAVNELPVIYGFNNGGSGSFLNAVLLAEDGEGLGSHACSSEAYMPSDLGILENTRPDRHEAFKNHYPDGYRMEFISGNDVASHEGLTLAYKKNQDLHKKDDE